MKARLGRENRRDLLLDQHTVVDTMMVHLTSNEAVAIATALRRCKTPILQQLRTEMEDRLVYGNPRS